MYFFEISQFLAFLDSSSKTSDFMSKTQNFKNPMDSGFVELFIARIFAFLLFSVYYNTRYLTNFQISSTSRLIFFFAGVKLMPEKVGKNGDAARRLFLRFSRP